MHDLSHAEISVLIFKAISSVFIEIAATRRCSTCCDDGERQYAHFSGVLHNGLCRKRSANPNEERQAINGSIYFDFAAALVEYSSHPVPPLASVREINGPLGSAFADYGRNQQIRANQELIFYLIGLFIVRIVEPQWSHHGSSGLLMLMK